MHQTLSSSSCWGQSSEERFGNLHRLGSGAVLCAEMCWCLAAPPGGRQNPRADPPTHGLHLRTRAMGARADPESHWPEPQQASADSSCSRRKEEALGTLMEVHFVSTANLN